MWRNRTREPGQLLKTPNRNRAALAESMLSVTSDSTKVVVAPPLRSSSQQRDGDHRLEEPAFTVCGRMRGCAREFRVRARPPATILAQRFRVPAPGSPQSAAFALGGVRRDGKYRDGSSPSATVVRPPRSGRPIQPMRLWEDRYVLSELRHHASDRTRTHPANPARLLPTP